MRLLENIRNINCTCVSTIQSQTKYWRREQGLRDMILTLRVWRVKQSRTVIYHPSISFDHNDKQINRT